MSICINCEKYKNNEHCIDNIEFCEYQLAEHDKQIRADAFDEVSKSIKTNWLFRGADGKPYREEIDKIVEELKEQNK